MSTDIQHIYCRLLARNYTVEPFAEARLDGYKRAGRDLLADCPFCGKPDHLYCSLDKPVYHCFVCKAGGDWLDFLQKQRGLNFREALQHLAQAAGVRLGGFDEAAYRQKARTRDILDVAQRFFSAQFDSATVA
jgi:DNA primase